MFVIKPLKRKIIFYGSSFCKLWAEIQNHARLCAENCPGQVPVIKFESAIELLSKENTLERAVMWDLLKKRILAYPKYGLGYNLMRN